MSKHSTGKTIAKGAMALFGLVVILVNAFVTWQFGVHFLNGAFGIESPQIAAIAGGAYAILFLDIASLVWLFAYMRLAETSAQRGISIAASVIAFVGSLLATTYMLASGTSGALATVRDGVASAAQIAMIAIVVVHAVLLVAYLLTSREEAVAQTTINATTSATGEALELASRNVTSMVPMLAAEIGDAIQTQILASLNFTRAKDGALQYHGFEQGQTRPSAALPTQQTEAAALPATPPVADQPAEKPATSDGMDDGWGTNGEWLERTYGLSKEEVLAYLRKEEKRNAGRFHMSVRWGRDSYAFDLNRELFGDRLAAAVLAARYQNGAPLPPANGRG